MSLADWLNVTITNVRPDADEEAHETASPPDGRPNSESNGWLLVAGAASLAAGATHAAAVAAHSEHRQSVWAFVALAVAQLVWGSVALVRNDRRLAVVGGLIGAAALAGWVLATTTGLPFVEGLDEAQNARLVDQFAAGLAAVTLVTCVASLAARRVHLPRAAAIATAIALVAVGVPSAAAAVNHGHDGPPAVPAAVPPKGFTPGLPIDLSGVPGVSLQQQARAEALLARTVERLPKWSDPAFAEANGFRSIRDGSTGVEHYLNRAFIEDDVMLDPDQPESLVYDTTVSPKKLVAAMYMATPGTTLDTVPDIGGALTQWHIHNNLCFNGQGQVAGLTQGDGSCRPPLVKGEELPMIHAWIESRPCGPFSALEGIGAGQVKPGDTKAFNAIHG